MSVRHALLALLSEGPKYGLQLREEFEARTGEVWPLNVGQVYTTLQRLERDGLVESDGDGQDGPQKGFRITAAGAQELTGWLRTPTDMSSPPRDELVMKVLVALRMPGTDARDVIQVHRRYLVELMQQWTRIKESEAESDMSLALVVDAELFRLDPRTHVVAVVVHHIATDGWSLALLVHELDTGYRNGVVYAAFDPDLDRGGVVGRVAVDLPRRVSDRPAVALAPGVDRVMGVLEPLDRPEEDRRGDLPRRVAAHPVGHDEQ